MSYQIFSHHSNWFWAFSTIKPWSLHLTLHALPIQYYVLPKQCLCCSIFGLHVKTCYCKHVTKVRVLVRWGSKYNTRKTHYQIGLHPKVSSTPPYIVNIIGRTYVFSHMIDNMKYDNHKGWSGFYLFFLLMLHHRFASATQASLCKCNW